MILSFGPIWLAALSACPAIAGNYSAATFAQLASAINSANANPGSTIDMTPTISVTGQLPDVTANTTIKGHNNTLDGASGNYSGLSIKSNVNSGYTATVNNLTVQNFGYISSSGVLNGGPGIYAGAAGLYVNLNGCGCMNNIGGLWYGGQNLSCSSCTFSGNTARNGAPCMPTALVTL